MRAIRIVTSHEDGGDTKKATTQRLVLLTMPVPKETPGTVLVQIKAVAINPSDAANSRGYFPHTTLPRTPGRDWAGIVVSKGHILTGQRVFGTSGRHMGFTFDGPSAEYCAIPEAGLVPLPRSISFTQAATLGVPWTTAYLMLKRVAVSSTDVVLVVGSSGAVGSAACQLAKARGCRIITAARRQFADIDLSEGPGAFGNISTMTSGPGPDVVLDTVGSPELMDLALKSLRVGGRLAYISAPKSYNAQFSFDMKSLYRTEKSIVGCNSLQHDIKEMNDILRELAPSFGSRGTYSMPDPDEITAVGMDRALEMYEQTFMIGV
ncbi:hypothetical protein M409DRAFT_71672 [Zasmidium cellare ATCC 36951]|uniref:Enoyl reductase (ER) domain-containing protein n=1 Tax=Zasmidium cellare ATCC 36951 TaxID=1080233 RepID=A0A6A6BXX4_ZASCE|nr:uncharacterized protein M409DRAFT_71672 [Zasmidium cellare ATCC 36951]KAF2158389.1 hypothetical protein M409DRAFT_71672 [Zasmidium cellare ATCC 36951]